ncbi:MAG: type II CAAX endopeptidase family protein [Phenylobacterium sp.]
MPPPHPRRSPLAFFALVFLLSIPFWMVGQATDLRLVQGLPIAALAVACPAAAAAILVWREHRARGLAELLRRCFDFRRTRAPVWYIPVILLTPAVAVLAYGLQGAPPIRPIPLTAPLLLFLVFFVAGLCEELGWSGYVIDPLQGRWGALRASLIVGAVWAAWHVIPLVQMHHPPAWIAWWCLATVGLRVLMVWLYNNTGKSVFAMALFHAMSNVAMLLVPALYDPRLWGAILAATAVVVALVWGPRTLVRGRAS